MTHTISYEDALESIQQVPICIASSSGPDGSKRLLRVGELFQVITGKDKTTFEFATLREAVDVYNTTREAH